jgi:predicted  nucleic acid-binding Zn-ribbon protein
MDGAQTASILGIVAMVLGTLLAYFKFKPGQRERVAAESGLAEVDIAQGTLKMTKEALDLIQGNMQAEINRLVEQTTKFRDDSEKRAGDQDRRLTAVTRALAEMQVQLGVTERRLDLVTQERDELRQENEALRGRIASLENEVRELKGRA